MTACNNVTSNTACWDRTGSSSVRLTPFLNQLGSDLVSISYALDPFSYLLFFYYWFITKSHHESQHSQRWEEYQTLSTEKKQNYFSTKSAPFIESIHAYFGKSDELKFCIKQELVDVIIDVFFHPDHHGDISHSRTFVLYLSLLSLNPDKPNTL
jgi:hypothetical protein